MGAGALLVVAGLVHWKGARSEMFLVPEGGGGGRTSVEGMRFGEGREGEGGGGYVLIRSSICGL